jgi:hypothetical protein
MLSVEKSALLQNLLGGLPPKAAVRLARAVEVDRLAGGAILPHELILNALRPTLRTPMSVERTPTPLRVFCRPFEDIISDSKSGEKQKGRIARSNIAIMWSWLSESVIPEETAGYTREVRSLVLSGRLEQAVAYAAGFWTYAAKAMRDAIARDRKAARLALRGDSVVADAEEMALLLSIGPIVLEMQRLLEKPVIELTEEMLWKLRDIHERLIATAPDAAPYVAVIAMNRLLHPWEALKLTQFITRQTRDTLIANTDMGLVGELLLADIETHGNAVRAARHPVFDPRTLIEHLANFAELSSCIVRELEIRRDGKWGKRLLADRAAVAEAMEGLMERAPKEISAVLPTLKSGSYGGGPRIPDFSKPVDDERAERGLRYAKLVRGCELYAAMGSFAAAQKEAMGEACQHLRSYNEDLVKEMRGADGPRRAIAERQYGLAVELTAILFSAEEAEFLRRRGKAALATAA